MAHKQLKAEGRHALPTVSIDYAFFNTKKGKKGEGKRGSDPALVSGPEPAGKGKKGKLGAVVCSPTRRAKTTPKVPAVAVPESKLLVLKRTEQCTLHGRQVEQDAAPLRA